jgi:hypothetical protein
MVAMPSSFQRQGGGDADRRTGGGDEQGGVQAGAAGEPAPENAAQGHGTEEHGEVDREPARSDPRRKRHLGGDVEAGENGDPGRTGQQAGGQRHRHHGEPRQGGHGDGE